MRKYKLGRVLALIVSVIMLVTSTVQTTFGLIATKTDPLINTFTPFESLVSNLLISKNVEHPFGEGYVIPDDIEFDFEVALGSLYANTTVKTTAGNVVANENGVINVSVKPGKSIGIEDIDEGTKVTVTEVQMDGSGFAVKDGVATKEATISADGSVSVDYVNVYTPKKVKPTIVDVSGIKILEGREWQEGDSFTILLEQNTGKDKWKELGTKTVTYDAENEDFNKFDFSDIIHDLKFDEIGTYSFRISEIVGDLENVDYDKTVNYFTIKVSDNDMDGKLEIQNVTASQNAVVTKDETTGEYDVVVTINNTFVPPVVPDPDDISVPVTVNKTVENTGTDAIGPENFEFVLENITTGDKTAIRTDAAGKAVFDLTFTADDIGKIYNYKLSETDEGKIGITYDEDIYAIQISIALSEDNELAATVISNGVVVENCVAQFENTYHTDDEPTPPTGDSSNLIFWFIMMLVSGAAVITLVITFRKKKPTIKD